MTVTCRICGKTFKRLTRTHLRTHGMTLKEYLGVSDYFLRHLYIDRGMGTREIARIVGVRDHKTVSRWLREAGIQLRPPFSENSGKPIDVRLEMNRDLAYFIGVMMGDGSLSKNNVTLCVKDEEFARSFYDCLKRLGLNPTIWYGTVYNHRKYWQVAGYSSKLVKWVKHIRGNIKMIETLLGEDKELISSFIRGFYESEGTYINDRKKRNVYIRMYNSDKRRVDVVVHLLRKLGFCPKVYTYRRGQTVEYIIHIGGRRQVELFLSTIKPVIKVGEVRRGEPGRVNSVCKAIVR